MASGDILNVGVSGLKAFQKTLATIGHNVANVNTEGYSRQRVEIVSNYPTPQTNGFVGTGARAVTTQRMFEETAVNQLRYRSSTYQHYQAFVDMAEQIDNLLADKSAGLDPAIQGFFDSVQQVADDPTSIPARSVMLNDANVLVTRFHSTSQLLSDARVAVNKRVDGLVNQINTLSTLIASANKDIVIAAGLGRGQPPNDLLDKRDKLITDLSQVIGVSTLKQDDGSVNVFIGNGQGIVLGMRSVDLKSAPNPDDVQFNDIYYAPPFLPSPINITDRMSDGELGGLLDFRNRVLLPAINQVGRVAIGISDIFDKQHALGMDLNNRLGTASFFATPVPSVASSTLNTGLANVTATINVLNGVSNLTAHDYQVSFDGVNWNLLDTTTKVSTVIAPAPGAGVATPYLNLNNTGLDITIDLTGGAAVVGDTWNIRPTRDASRTIALNVTDPRDIAAADPVRTLKGVNNLGDAKISPATILDLTLPIFQPPPIPPGFNNLGTATQPGNMRIRFLTGLPGLPSTSYEVDDPVTGLPIAGGAGPFPYTAGTPINLPPGGGPPYPLQVTIVGSPQGGDTFDVEYNTNGFSDNRNARSMADLQRSTVLVGGTATFQETYSQLVVQVGSLTRDGKINTDAQEALKTQSEELVQSISGVNLDEEAANMLKYQQSYSAAAQIIATANTVFQTLLAAVRG
ncbi:MAG: flagellar hook-associated protein FlgK [Gammaproteobacteria bacterium]|nr:flagellar hook-associated protein FlgK [Gammaproteobacteria bacterium]